jgi:hypothetical protein
LRLRTVLLIGLAARLAIAPFFAHPLDVYSWYNFGEEAMNGSRSISSYLVPYEYSFFLFVFPATIAYNFLSAHLGSSTFAMSSLNPALNPGQLWNISVVPGPLFDLLVKLPLIASDLTIALLIYKIVLKHMSNKELAVTASAVWFLNPLSIWVSSGWGMFDTIPAAFTVLLLYFYLDEKPVPAAISLAVAIAMKYYAAVLFPVVAIGLWRRNRTIGTKFIVTSVFLVLALMLPFLGMNLSRTAYFLAGSSLAGNGIHYSGLGFWSVLTLSFADFDPSLVSFLALAVLLTMVYFWYWKRSPVGGLVRETYSFIVPLLALLLLYRFVAENYIIWLLPFLSLTYLKDRLTRGGYWSLSFVALLSSVSNSLLPYYMLPVAPWIGGTLVWMLGIIGPFRAAPGGVLSPNWGVGKIVLSSLGVLSAVILSALLVWVFLRDRQLRAESSP